MDYANNTKSSRQEVLKCLLELHSLMPVMYYTALVEVRHYLATLLNGYRLVLLFAGEALALMLCGGRLPAGDVG